MPDQRTLRITSLRERIARAEYHVDVDKVAEAVLARPTARMLIVPPSAIVAEPEAGDLADEGHHPAGSEDVLEAA